MKVKIFHRITGELKNANAGQSAVGKLNFPRFGFKRSVVIPQGDAAGIAHSFHGTGTLRIGSNGSKGREQGSNTMSKSFYQFVAAAVRTGGWSGFSSCGENNLSCVNLMLIA